MIAPAHQAQYWVRNDATVTCTLCPHGCVLPDGATGRCGIRRNDGGTLALPFYGHVSSVALDPIEKKPLFHYHPGSQILSVGFLGCNMRCPFCQNYTISQSTASATAELCPDEIVRRALLGRSFGVAYTYNEPSIHFEYVCATGDLARRSGLKNVMVTNGQLCADPAAELLQRMDAVNVDLKSFDSRFYRHELGGDLDTVKQFIAIAARSCHVEVTTLLIPGKNDSEDEIAGIAAFIASVDQQIPLHISAYYPTYHYTYNRTTPDEVRRAVHIARRVLSYVYPGNVPEEADTICPKCGNLLIERHGYQISTPGLSGTSCSACGTPVPVVLD